MAGHLRAAPVTVDTGDLAPTVAAIRDAGLLSTALAAELDRSAGAIGQRPQPHLAAAHAATLATPALVEDAARRTGQLHQQTPNPAGQTPQPPRRPARR